MHDRIAFGSFELDLRQRVLFRQGAPVSLGSRASDLLCELARVPGDLVTKDALIARVWPETVVEENNLQVQVSAIRKALATEEQGRHWLQTVPGRGYRFVAPVRPLDALSHAPAPAPVQGLEVAATPDPGCPTPPDQPAIAVLPFANLSADPEQQYFADGVVEDIITTLSRFSELFVIARNSSFALRERAGDLHQVARELGVRYVLTGSVRKAGGCLRITGQLVDANSLRHLWADHFDGAPEDVFALQDQVTARVVGALLPTVRHAEIERARRKPPAGLDAYDYLLRALPSVMANAATPAAQAIKLLERALCLNPDYAYAHALISMAYAQIYRATTGPERDDLRARASVHARQALELGAEDSLALAYAGFILLVTAQDVPAARAALDRAVALNPNSSTILSYRSLVLAMTGDHVVAVADAMAALRLSPLDPMIYQPQMAVVIARIGQGDYDDAVQWAHKAIDCAPASYPMSYAWLIVAECARGNLGEARRQAQRLAAILADDDPARLVRLFDIFPDPLRTDSVAMLERARLIPR